jgi:magnesium chelatase family protein
MADVKDSFKPSGGWRSPRRGITTSFSWVPRSGKTMLARALRGILPPLSKEDFMEVLLVRSPWV